MYDRQAFDQLVRQYQSPVRRFFLNQTLGDRALSDDLAQETFIRAYTHMDTFPLASHLSPLTSKIDIYQALALLKDEERTCITLQLVDGYDITAISRITQMKEGTVKSHLSRGKEKMAQYLRKNGYAPHLSPVTFQPPVDAVLCGGVCRTVCGVPRLGVAERPPGGHAPHAGCRVI